MNIRWTIATQARPGRWVRVICAIVLAVCWSGYTGGSHAAPGCALEVARIVSIQGVIEVRRIQAAHWQPAGLNETLCAGDRIRARSHSRASLRLSNDSMLRLDQKTSLTFPEIQTDSASASLLDLLKGAIHIITRTPRPFRITTPFVNASVEGTEFFVGLEHDAAKVVVYEGKVAVSNAAGSVHLHDHEAAVALNGQAPRKDLVIRPTDAVHWALHYPVILNDQQAAPAKSDQSANALVRQASRLMTAGQAREARIVIEQALQLEPGHNDAYALLAIIAVTQNEKDQALDLAMQAVTGEHPSAAAYLALSYAQQANFDVETAVYSVQKALTLDAGNALSWARLAELRMSIGDLDLALEAAQQAVNNNPGVAKTQTVLGFAHLLQINVESAKAAFIQAIMLDQADPQPRLGLGIALIRQGELQAGRVELEIAASLDPANSLIRSYLGKAYFEEKRYPLAGTQFDLARERDPRDPTPWFYDAIQKQTQNRPVEALRDIQKSIALNDKRAVYRSKFLLDRDEAARGSSLARIFENLGFERRAIMETAKSLSFDPANHAAHRFLSDTYAHMPRHEIARASELLQAQLLQPINVNPVQPHMAVADLNIITGTGPTAPSFNEFAPLFERNKTQLVASGVVGNQGTLGNEIVASAVYDRLSFSLGQFHYETDGFRRNDFDATNPNFDRAIRDGGLEMACQSANGCRNNNGAIHNVYNAFVQYAVTPKFNLQAELRSRATEHGDFASHNFYFRDYHPFFKRRLHENSARIGARYSPSVNQDVIVSTTVIDRSEKINTLPYASTGIHVEAQHLFRQEYLYTVTGGGVYRFDSEKGPPFANRAGAAGLADIPAQLNRESFYNYTHINSFKNISFTAGLGFDSYTHSEGSRKEEINPKIGVQWNISDSLRFRAAWFETTKSHLIGQQTIEPTQVAGFNQFFDDPNGTRARRMGLGLDAHFLNVYSGIEASIRQLNVPIKTAFSDEQKIDEQFHRAYLYWLPHVFWAFRTELRFEDARRKSLFTGDPTHIQTISIPFHLEYFHPSGFFSGFSATYVNQQLSRKDTPNHPWLYDSGKSSFYLLDFNAGFRFPDRRGMISVEGRNLLDKEFFYRNSYFFVSQDEPRLYSPDRTIFLKLTLNY